MRLSRTAVTILGLFLPLVIQAQPFGETEVAVFDTDFLPVPPGPRPALPPEALAPAWIPSSDRAPAADARPWAPGDQA